VTTICCVALAFLRLPFGNVAFQPIQCPLQMGQISAHLVPQCPPPSAIHWHWESPGKMEEVRNSNVAHMSSSQGREKWMLIYAPNALFRKMVNGMFSKYLNVWAVTADGRKPCLPPRMQFCQNTLGRAILITLSQPRKTKTVHCVWMGNKAHSYLLYAGDGLTVQHAKKTGCH
jgi:hypothetical protein